MWLLCCNSEMILRDLFIGQCSVGQECKGLYLYPPYLLIWTNVSLIPFIMKKTSQSPQSVHVMKYRCLVPKALYDLTVIRQSTGGYPVSLYLRHKCKVSGEVFPSGQTLPLGRSVSQRFTTPGCLACYRVPHSADNEGTGEVCGFNCWAETLKAQGL